MTIRLGWTALAVFGVLGGLLAAGIGAPPAIGSCPLFPADNIWNTPVSKLPADPHSNAFVQSIGSEKPLHPDFGSAIYNGAPIGIPFILVPGNQKRVPVKFEYSSESDLTNYPIPADAPIEGGRNSTGDRHVLLIDKENCVLWELFAAAPQADGSWQAASGAIFDLKSNSLRPDGWTSADAAGLPILPGLTRYDELASGEIRHALRFTAPKTRKGSVWPARHSASRFTDSQLPQLGQRFRLKASYDISGFAPLVQIILRAMKEYGMILADNGSSWYISGAPDERWEDGVLSQLGRVKGSDFEAVDTSGLFVAQHSARAKQIR